MQCWPLCGRLHGSEPPSGDRRRGACERCRHGVSGWRNRQRTRTVSFGDASLPWNRDLVMRRFQRATGGSRFPRQPEGRNHRSVVRGGPDRPKGHSAAGEVDPVPAPRPRTTDSQRHAGYGGANPARDCGGDLQQYAVVLLPVFPASDQSQPLGSATMKYAIRRAVSDHPRAASNR
jgi:hypothetical protein